MRHILQWYTSYCHSRAMMLFWLFDIVSKGGNTIVLEETGSCRATSEFSSLLPCPMFSLIFIYIISWEFISLYHSRYAARQEAIVMLFCFAPAFLDNVITRTSEFTKVQVCALCYCLLVLWPNTINVNFNKMLYRIRDCCLCSQCKQCVAMWWNRTR